MSLYQVIVSSTTSPCQVGKVLAPTAGSQLCKDLQSEEDESSIPPPILCTMIRLEGNPVLTLTRSSRPRAHLDFPEDVNLSVLAAQKHKSEVLGTPT